MKKVDVSVIFLHSVDFITKLLSNIYMEVYNVYAQKHLEDTL